MNPYRAGTNPTSIRTTATIATTPLRSVVNNDAPQGRMLEGGKVMDFASVRASTAAETALLRARPTSQLDTPTATTTMNTINTTAATRMPQQHQLLGINQDVVAQVGHELGVFATNAQIQQCASYLRSLAPDGFFLTNDDTDNASNVDSPTTTVLTPDDCNSILQQAYMESGEVTSAFAKTFYMGTMLLPEPARQAIWAIYVWCRRTDEIVDAPRDNSDEMMRDLATWELRLEQLFHRGWVVDAYDLCLLHVRVLYPTMDMVPFSDMIRGMLMDVPSLGQDRYATFDELHLYCYRVAGTVGLMSLPIFGCADDYNNELAR
jgi:phytoene synthase